MKKNLPNGWKWARLGDVAEYVNGRAFKPTDWGQHGLPIIRIQNLNSAGATFNYFDGHIDDRYRVLNGDLLISWSASLDAFIWQGGEAILNQHIFNVKEDRNIVTRRYLYHVVRNAMAKIRSQVHGATMQHITKPRFEAITIPLPPLEEQRRIGSILEKADALRKKRRRTIAELDRLLQSMFLDTFGDPVINPKDWPLLRLGEALSIPLRNGLSPSKTGKMHARVLTLSAITGNQFDATAIKTSTFQVAPPSHQTIDDADFLICRGNGNLHLVGKGYFATRKMPDVIFPDTMIAARVTPKRMNRIFLQYVWNSAAVRSQVERLARTTNGTFKVNQTMLEGIAFYAPPHRLQRQFAQSACTVEELKAKQRESFAKLDALFSSLQHRAFRGEL